MKNLYQVLNSIFIYLRTLIVLVILGPPVMIFMILVPEYAYKAASVFSYIIFKSLGVRYKISGDFPDNGPYVIMHNHSSFLDIFFLPIVIKGKYTGIIAAKNFKIPIIGLIMRSMKGIPIHRKNMIHSRKSIEIAQERIKEGYHIAIFPEGTRTITGNLSQLKKGGFHMAINTGISIIPVGVSGAFDFKPKNRWWFRPGPITVNIGDAINPNIYGELGIDGLKNKVGQALKALLGTTTEVE